MDTDLLKASMPVVGGTLALLGGVFTFVSGRLRDAPDETAKSEVIALTWLYAAGAFWFIGIALATFAKLPLFSIPFYCACLIIHLKLFVSVPEPASRKAIAMFALLCAVTAFAILFAVFAHFFDRMLDIQSLQLELLRKTIEAMKPLGK